VAQVVRIRDTPAEAKIRHPLAVFGLVLLTLGIYYFVWYYKVNRELRDLGRAAGEPERLGTSPLTSLVAITFGAFIIVPPFVSFYNTFRRIEAAQEMSGTAERVSVALGFVLFLVGLIFFPVEVIYAQDELNRVWRAEADRGTPA
jgi:Ca2+/Na+ antiporter